MIVRLLLAATVAAAVPVGARAQDEPARSEGVRSDFWRQVDEPRYRRSRTLLRHALRRLQDFEQPPPGLGHAQRRAILEGAIHRLELASRIAPRDPEILFLLARSKARWVQRTLAGGEQRLDEEAIELFERLRLVDPDYESQEVAFQLGVLHTRQQRFDRAAEEYLRSIDHELLVGSSPVAWGNLAEVTMLSGDVAGAVEHFERAVELYRRNGSGGDLALWGLAVALDRLGEHRSALDRTREALSHGGGEMSVLRSDGVFFEPAWEVYWYEALGHEALAEMQSDAQARRRMLEAALHSWDLFLRESDGASPWDEIARRNAEQVRAELSPPEGQSRRRRRTGMSSDGANVIERRTTRTR